MSMEQYLSACDTCNKVLGYYDYISHIEVCINRRNPNNLNNPNNPNNPYDNYCNDSDMYDADDDADDDAYDDADDDINETYNNELEQLNDNTMNTMNISILNNLYNPLINRNLNVYNNSHNNENMLNLSNQISSMNIDTGLGCDNLPNYSVQIPIISQTECVICMDTFNKGDSFYLMTCMHSFCVKCSERWFDFKSVCPLCKTNFKN